MTSARTAAPHDVVLAPRARLELLVDPGTLRAGGANDEHVTVGEGRIDHRGVRLFACNGLVSGGALGVAGCRAIVQTIERAVTDDVPVIGVWHSGGARLQEGTSSLDAIGRVFSAIVRASGRVPQVSVVLGPAAGGAAYAPALTDVVIAGPSARIFVTGPDVVRRVTGEVVDGTALGGNEVHTRSSGVVHAVGETDERALQLARQVVRTLTPHPGTRPVNLATPGLREVLPASPRQVYDVRRVVELLLDPTPGHVELHASWARNVVTTLGNLDGRPVGVLANNPLHLAGCLDAVGSEKAARFVRGCDALGVSLVVLVDTPGYLPGRSQEAEGIVRRGAKLLHAFAEAEVPRMTVILRKAFGGAFVSMNSKALGASAVLAWPEADVGVMHAEAAVQILHRRALVSVDASDRDDLRCRLAAEYAMGTGGLPHALAQGLVDRLVAPEDTRTALANLLAAYPSGRGRHSNGPL